MRFSHRLISSASGPFALISESVGPKVSRALQNSEINRLARNAAWASFGVVLSQVITLVAYMLLARFIGKERFGEFTIIQGTANTVSAFAGLGLGISATKLVAEFRDREPDRAGSLFTLIFAISVIWTLLLAVGVWITAPQIATTLLNRAELTSSVRVGAVLLFFTTIMNVQNGALVGFESFDATAKTSMLRGFLILPFLLAGAGIRGVNGALAGFAAAGAIVCFINSELLRRRCLRFGMKLGFGNAWGQIRCLANFSIPAFLTNIAPAPCLSIAQILLIRQADGYGELAVFTAALQLRTGIVLLPNLLSQPLVPMIASYAKDQASSRRSLMRAASVATLLVAIGLATIVCLFPKYLMMAYGHAFTGNTGALVLLAFSAVVNSGIGPFNSAVTANGKMWSLFVAFALWGGAFIATTCLLLPALHGTALAAAYLVADLVQAVVILIAYRRGERESYREHRGLRYHARDDDCAF